MEVCCIFIAKAIDSFNPKKAGRIVLLAFFLVDLTFSGCQKKKNITDGFAPDSSIYGDKNYSELTLDSTDLTTFFQNHKVSDALRNEINVFYGNRNLYYAWFNQFGVTCAINTFYSRIQSYRVDFGDNTFDNIQLDSLISALNTDEKTFLEQSNQVKQLEVLLTATFFKYSEKVYGGLTRKTSRLDWFIPWKKKDYQVLLDSLVSSAKCEKLQEPVNQYYIHLKEKLNRYRIIQKAGGFQQITSPKRELSIGDVDSCLLATKHHLHLTGDLVINDKTSIFTDSLRLAVKHFQHRMGLVENGKIGKATFLELNYPIGFRIKQIMLNLERLRWIPVEMEANYILVNIPAFTLYIFENDRQVWETNVVVGQTARKTSIFKGNLSQIILNPYWGVPMSIGKTEILGHLQRNSNYLAQNKMEVLLGEKVINPSNINWNQYKNSLPYTFRQKPGKNNALGKVKFMFPNNYQIYLHDTPAKNLFNSNKRAFSHGCIRVENPMKLANYLLRNNIAWNPQKVNEILHTNQETSIRINPTVAVYIAYFTAWVDNNGQLNFRNDLYHLDEKLSKDIFGE
jgi:murein L,D-transpeptidase YcbB/YkuD